MSLRWVRRAWKRRVWIYVLRRIHPEIQVRVGGRRMVMDLRDRALARTLYLSEDHEPELQALMRQMSLQGGVCLDVGANIGFHTVLMSQLVGPSDKVVAFEPEARNFRLLDLNLRLNGATNVTALRTAVGDRTGTCRLALNPKNYGDNRVADSGSMPWESREVPLTTVDEALADLPDGAVKFIKIDVQGYEWHVLQGMKATLDRNREAIVAIEIFPGALRQAGSSPGELMRSLRELGLSGWEFSRHRILPIPEPWVYDLMRGGSVDAILSRNPERLTSLLTRTYSLSVPKPR